MSNRIKHHLKKKLLKIGGHCPITGEIYSKDNLPSCDHVVSRKNGGKADKYNLFIMSERKNVEKDVMDFDVFILLEYKHNRKLLRNLKVSFEEILPLDREYVIYYKEMIENILGKKIKVAGLEK
jgi:hypothetical protein